MTLLAAVRDSQDYQPAIFRWSPATAVVWTVLLVVAAFAFNHTTLNVLSRVWDDGNTLYGWLALEAGQLPNIDFRHGYPGLMSWLQFYLFGDADAVFFWAKLTGFAFTLVIAICAFLVCFRSVSLLTAVGVFIFIVGASYSITPSANPGYGMAACIALGMTLIYLALETASGSAGRKSLREPLFILGGLLIGISVGFKQPGLIAMIGFLALVIVLAPREGAFRLLRPIVFAFGCVLPLLVFLIARVGPVIPMAPYRVVTVLPWIVATAWVWRFAFRQPGGLAGDAGLTARTAILAPLACGIGAVSWMLLYPLDFATQTAMLKEILVTVPQLIDRDPGIHKLNVGLLALVVSVSLLLVGLTHQPTASSPKFLRALAAIQRSWPAQWAVLIALVGTAIAVGGFWRELFITPALLGTVGGLLLYLDRDWWPSAAVFAVLLIGLVTTASLFPYAGNTRYVAIGLVACLAVFGWAIARRAQFDGLSLERPLLSGLALLYFGGVTAFGFSLIAIKTDIQSEFPPDSRFGTRVSPYTAPEADAAAWIGSQIQAGDTVAGYPNFAVICVLLEQPCHGFLPNFIGSEEDFEAMVASIHDGSGPTYFLVSPTLHPYPPNPPYFPQPGPLIEALEAEYRIAHVIEIPDWNAKILIYRSPSSNDEAGAKGEPG